jgi:hypothetical protein
VKKESEGVFRNRELAKRLIIQSFDQGDREGFIAIWTILTNQAPNQ